MLPYIHTVEDLKEQALFTAFDGRQYPGPECYDCKYVNEHGKEHYKCKTTWDRCPAVKAPLPAGTVTGVKLPTGVIIEGVYMMNSELDGANKIKLRDGAVCYTKGNKNIEFIIAGGTKWQPGSSKILD
jgi:hypothetical protein